MLWPQEANADRTAARRLIQAGELYVCMGRPRKEHWELLAVNIHALEAAAQPDTNAAPATDTASSGAALGARLAER